MPHTPHSYYELILRERYHELRIDALALDWLRQSRFHAIALTASANGSWFATCYNAGTEIATAAGKTRAAATEQALWLLGLGSAEDRATGA